jgi:hypothetical protein
LPWERTWAEKDGGDPDFLYAALDVAAYAAFFKESRVRCAGAIKLHRKSGGSPISAKLVQDVFVKTPTKSSS